MSSRRGQVLLLETILNEARQQSVRRMELQRNHPNSAGTKLSVGVGMCFQLYYEYDISGFICLLNFNRVMFVNLFCLFIYIFLL